jgi:hypothetical protein
MTYAEIAPLIDTGLALAMAGIIWAVYRQLRNRKTVADQ